MLRQWREDRNQVTNFQENEDESKTQADGGEQGQGEHPKKDQKDHKDHGHHRQGKKHSNDSNHSTGCKVRNYIYYFLDIRRTTFKDGEKPREVPQHCNTFRMIT